MTKPWDSISGDFNQDKRDPKPGEYSVAAVGGVGRVSCYRKGMTITDFYNNGPLIKDCGVAQSAEQGTTKSGSNPEVGGKAAGSNPVTATTDKPEETKVV